MVYVEELLLIGEDNKLKNLLKRLHIALNMTKDYYDSLPKLYNIKNNTNSLATTSTKRPPIETNEYLTRGQALEVPHKLWTNYFGCVHYDQTYNMLQNN
eukprot:4977759-Amphidinium_carterae.1